jgi:flagellar biosynthesis protein FlhF
MYVRKFEADNIEEALKDIKHELGPDAIILKTLTNKGLKGAFKKKKVEITAAISEKNYSKKAKVDSVLGQEQKQEFYSGSSSYVSNMIDSHDESTTNSANRGGYGQMGLNRAVSTTKKITKSMKSGLDDFLNTSEKRKTASPAEIEPYTFVPQREAAPKREEVEENEEFGEYVQEEVAAAPGNYRYEAPEETPTFNAADAELVELQRGKIDELERKLYDLAKSVEKFERDEPAGIFHLRTSLKSFDISEQFIQQVIKKALFELSSEDVEDSDIVFEYALREMMGIINCEMPLFSSNDETEVPAVTVLLSETTCGQSGMLQKIGALKEDAVLIRSQEKNSSKRSFTERVFGMDVVTAQSIAGIVTECRKAIEAGKTVFIDYKNISSELDETKKFVDGLRRAFGKVEVLISLSAIHSEIYNRKVMSCYQDFANGLVISHLDLCLNYGMLFNIAESAPELPFKFFGTGDVVPDDLEAATAERVVAGIFRLT